MEMKTLKGRRKKELKTYFRIDNKVVKSYLIELILLSLLLKSSQQNQRECEPNKTIKLQEILDTLLAFLKQSICLTVKQFVSQLFETLQSRYFLLLTDIISIWTTNEIM